MSICEVVGYTNIIGKVVWEDMQKCETHGELPPTGPPLACYSLLLPIAAQPAPSGEGTSSWGCQSPADLSSQHLTQISLYSACRGRGRCLVNVRLPGQTINAGKAGTEPIFFTFVSTPSA